MEERFLTFRSSAGSATHPSPPAEGISIANDQGSNCLPFWVYTGLISTGNPSSLMIGPNRGLLKDKFFNFSSSDRPRIVRRARRVFSLPVTVKCRVCKPLRLWLIAGAENNSGGADNTTGADEGGRLPIEEAARFRINRHCRDNKAARALLPGPLLCRPTPQSSCISLYVAGLSCRAIRISSSSRLERSSRHLLRRPSAPLLRLAAMPEDSPKGTRPRHPTRSLRPATYPSSSCACY